LREINPLFSWINEVFTLQQIFLKYWSQASTRLSLSNSRLWCQSSVSKIALSNISLSIFFFGEDLFFYDFLCYLFTDFGTVNDQSGSNISSGSSSAQTVLICGLAELVLIGRPWVGLGLYRSLVNSLSQTEFYAFCLSTSFNIFRSSGSYILLTL